jgi:hypothetical protein
MVLLCAASAGAAETYVGTTSDPKPTPVTVTIREYTSDERAFALAERLHKDGQAATLADLAKGDMGTVKVGDKTTRATMVRQEKLANGRIVRVVTERPLGPGTAPPDTVGYVELRLDAAGAGSGRLMTAVKAAFDADGFVVPESQGETWELPNVKPAP